MLAIRDAPKSSRHSIGAANAGLRRIFAPPKLARATAQSDFLTGAGEETCPHQSLSSTETELKQANLTSAMLDVLNVVKVSALANGAPPAKPASPEAKFKNAPDGRPEQPCAPSTNITERRSKVRYPIELEVRFVTSKESSSAYSIGRTVNISSSGLLISSACVVRLGTAMQVTIHWPFALDGRVPLQLAADGIVVRSSASNFAVEVRSYQFRTMKQQALVQQARATWRTS